MINSNVGFIAFKTSLTTLLLWAATAVSVHAQQTPGQGTRDREPFFLWTDNSISLLPYGWGFQIDPYEQSTITYEHAHASAIGDMFLFIDATKFHGDTPADDDTFYGEISPRLSLGKLTKRDLSFTTFEHGLFEVKDVLIAAQYERGEDPDLTEAALLGLGLDLDVRSAGILGRIGKFNYIQLNFYGRAELANNTENGISDMQITMVAAYPFKIGTALFLVDGYFDWVLGLGSEEWSYHLNPQITWDAGSAWFGEAGKLFAGVEYDMWLNKYQIPNSSELDTNQNAISFLVKYHF